MLADLERARNLMRAEELDALLVFSRENVLYLSGFGGVDPMGSGAVLLPVDDEPTLLQSKSDEFFIPGNASRDRKFFGDFYVEGATKNQGEFKNLPEGVSKEIERRRLRRIGIEDNLSVRMYETLRRNVPDSCLITSNILDELRTIKSDAEIDRLRRAAGIWEDAVLSVYERVGESMSELEVANELKAAIASRGGDCMWVEMGGLVGVPTFPSEHKLCKGDLLHIDMGALYDGYGADMARDAAIKEPTDKQTKINKALTTSLKKTVQSVRAGVKASDIFTVCQQTVRDAGFPQYRRHNVGHGIGLRCHENPILTPNSDVELRAGMVLCIEVPYYIKGVGAFNVEATTAVTEDANDLLSTLDRDLYVI